MNKLTHSYLISSFILLAAVAFQACAPSGGGQNNYRDVDMSTVAPDMSAKVFENDFVEAFVISIPFEQEFPTHQADDRLVFALNKFDIQSQSDAGTSTKTYEPGEVNKLSAGNYSFKNVGVNPIRFLTVSRNPVILPKDKAFVVRNGITKVAPEKSAILVEDDESRMIEIDLGPGEKISTFDGLPGMVYLLNDAQIKFLQPIKGAEKFWSTRGYQGEILWLEAGQYELMNTSRRKPAKLLMVGFKK